MTTVETIAKAIAYGHPESKPWAEGIARELAEAATWRNIGLEIAYCYVVDRPRRVLTAPQFLRWCEARGFMKRAEQAPLFADLEVAEEGSALSDKKIASHRWARRADNRR